MSASEKLKALLVLNDEEDDVDLPIAQIVAVVEATEAAMQTETVSALDEDDYTVWYDQPADRAPLAAALAALDEAL